LQDEKKHSFLKKEKKESENKELLSDEKESHRFEALKTKKGNKWGNR
jgi:hypothetical protein